MSQILGADAGAPALLMIEKGGSYCKLRITSGLTQVKETLIAGGGSQTVGFQAEGTSRSCMRDETFVRFETCALRSFHHALHRVWCEGGRSRGIYHLRVARVCFAARGVQCGEAGAL